MEKMDTAKIARQDRRPTLRPWRSHEAAEWSGMSERKLLQLAREGILPARKVGGIWYFSPDKLAAFFDVNLDR